MAARGAARDDLSRADRNPLHLRGAAVSFLDEDDKDEDATCVIRARGRLKEAKLWFAHRGWDVLPKGRRCKAILRWGADHACLASPGQPMRSVRNWCRHWARLKDTELDDILEYVKTSNKRW